jgi:hypothetical protein
MLSAKISRSPKEPTAKTKTNWLRCRTKGENGKWISHQVKYKASLSELEDLQDIASEIVRQRKTSKSGFTFELSEKIKDKIGTNNPKLELLVKANLLERPDNERFDFAFIRAKLEKFIDQQRAAGDIVKDTAFKRKNCLKKLSEYITLNHTDDYDIRFIDTTFVENFLDWLRLYRTAKDKDGNSTKRPLSISTVRKERDWLSSLFNELVRTGTIPKNPFDKVKVKGNKRREEAKEKERKQIIPFEILGMLEANLEVQNTGKNRGWYIYWLLTRYLGSRKNEALQLKWKDVFFDDLNGMGAINMPSPKTGGFRRCPMMHKTGWNRVDCELRERLLEERKRQNANDNDYVVQDILNLHKNSRDQVDWSNKNPSTTLEKKIIDAGFYPWGKLLQNLRVTRENELRRFSKWRPEAINQIIGHSEDTYESFYQTVNDDDFIDLGEWNDDVITDEETGLAYSPRYSPRLSTTGKEYVEKTQSKRSIIRENLDKSDLGQY